MSGLTAAAHTAVDNFGWWSKTTFLELWTNVILCFRQHCHSAVFFFNLPGQSENSLVITLKILQYVSISSWPVVILAW